MNFLNTYNDLTNNAWRNMPAVDCIVIPMAYDGIGDNKRSCVYNKILVQD